MMEPVLLERTQIRARSRHQNLTVWLSAAVLIVGLVAKSAHAEPPPAPCHANPTAAQDETTVRTRGDVSQLPAPLKDRLGQFANRPPSLPPPPVFAGADPA